MLPFSVLRMWGLGIFSWFVLGIGVYCTWRAYDEFHPSPLSREQPKEQRDSKTISPAERYDPKTTNESPGDLADEKVGPLDSSLINWPAWGFTVAAIILLGGSAGGGRWFHYFLGNATGPEPQSTSPAKIFWVERPTGAQLYCEIFGDSLKPTLLLTHGWSLDSSAWDYVKGDLSHQFRIVRWDLPGSGKSTCPGNCDFSLEAMAHDLEAVLQATANGQPVIFVSHSIGSMITQTYFRQFPTNLGIPVRAAVLVHATYTNPLRTCWLASLASALELPLITPLNYITIPLAPLAWLSNWQSYLNGSLHITTRLASFAGRQSWQQLDHACRLAAEAWPGYMSRGNLAMQRFDGEPVLPHVNIPVLVLAGEHDRLTLSDASDHIERLLPDGRPYRLPSGHLSFLECATDFAKIITEFAVTVIDETAQATAEQAALQAPFRQIAD